MQNKLVTSNHKKHQKF